MEVRMLRVIRLLPLIGFVLSLAGEPALAQVPASGTQLIADNYTIDYVEPVDAATFDPVMQGLKTASFLENLGGIVSFVKLPHRLRLRTNECGMRNAFYRSNERSLTMCYEMVQWYDKNMPQRPFLNIAPAELAAGAVTSVAFHELGHALFDQLKVPILGSEEDAADQMAALLLLQVDKDLARKAIFGMAYYGRLDVDPQQRDDFADVHGTPSQRFYNTLCMAYGFDPATFRDVVELGLLPRARAAGCDREYRQVENAFVKTIFPHLDQDKLRATRAEQPAPAPAPVQ